jgi:hypothetical protein
MGRRIKSPEDLSWLMEHAQAFRGGQISDLHVRKQRLLEETTGREFVAGTTIALIIRYEPAAATDQDLFSISRVARLVMKGVTDFSVFEQEGADFSEIGVVHAEARGGRLRFWFDPHGELYVICDEAEIDEVSRPGLGPKARGSMTEWTFQSRTGPPPDIGWLLDRLDRAGMPCSCRAGKASPTSHPALRWTGRFVPAGMRDLSRGAGVHVHAYCGLDGPGFCVTLRASDPHEPPTGQLLMLLADIIARNYNGMCLARNQILDRDEWLAAGR